MALSSANIRTSDAKPYTYSKLYVVSLHSGSHLHSKFLPKLSSNLCAADQILA